MRTAIVFLVIAFLLLAALSRGGVLSFTGSTVDLRVQDTYLMMEKWAFATLVFLLAATFFAVGGLLGTGFRGRFFWVAFLMVALAWSGVAAYLYWG